MAKKKIFNPDEHTEIPKSFSGTSKIAEIKSYDSITGIVLSNWEELEYALRVYNNEILPNNVPKSEYPTEQFRKTIEEVNGPFAMSIIDQAIEKARGKVDIVKKILDYAKPYLDKIGEFDWDLDSLGFGSEFYKTTVKIDKFGEFYVLGLSGLSGKYEEAFKASLGKSQLERQLELKESGAEAIISTVDDWWFNIDLADLLKNVPVSKKDTKVMSKFFTHTDCYLTYPRLTYKHNGEKYKFAAYYTNDLFGRRVRRPEGWLDFIKMQENRGSNFVGIAWTSDRNTMEPKPNLPVFRFSLKPYDKESRAAMLVDYTKRESMQKARDYLVQELTQK
jgi:hypothetical protein